MSETVQPWNVRYVVWDPTKQAIIVEGTVGQLNDCFGLSDDPTPEDMRLHCEERGYWFYQRVCAPIV